MNIRAAEEEEPVSVSGQELDIPADIEWQMLDKGKFFLHGAVLFSAVTAVLYPVVVLKTRQQVVHCKVSCVKQAVSVVRHEGFRALYRGFGTSLMGTIPARTLYMAAFEVTKSKVGSFAVSELGFTEGTAAAVASAVGGLTAAMAAQLVWTPIDVVTQRLMVANAGDCRYVNGVDMFRKIVRNDGVRGLYRGFGISILTHAPSNAVWWASYSVTQRLVWGGIGCFLGHRGSDPSEGNVMIRPDSRSVMAVQGASAAMAGGISALITMPLDTVKTRFQVLDGDDNNGRRIPTVGQTVRNLVKEGGWMACYRGLGPRCASMSISATTMITTYEFLKRTSTKNPEALT